MFNVTELFYRTQVIRFCSVERYNFFREKKKKKKIKAKKRRETDRQIKTEPVKMVISMYAPQSFRGFQIPGKLPVGQYIIIYCVIKCACR